MGSELVEDLTVIQGSTFFVSDKSGDVHGRVGEGLFVADVRHLSVWRLLADGAPMFLLSSRSLDYGRALSFGTLAGAHVGHNPAISIVRERRVMNGVHESVTIENHSVKDQTIVLDLEAGADFIDIFEVKERPLADASEQLGEAWIEHEADTLSLCHRQQGFERRTLISFDRPCDLDGPRARWQLTLPARQRWHLDIDISFAGDGIGSAPPDQVAGRTSDRSEVRVLEFLDRAPALQTDSELLRRTYEQSIVDLAALSLPTTDPDGPGVPAAGLPWFMTLFGRDSLITAYQALPFMPELARATLRSLAALQATQDDAFRDAEPGKILHELRRGKLALLGRTPHTPYYGTHDATPLFLVVLDEYERWTADRELVVELKGAALAALDWIESSGDLDGDGYLEYRTRSSRGLDNQCWKDSFDSIAFADGTRAEPPLATCEIQGYAYDARRRLARLSREVWLDDALATRLEDDARSLRERFNRDFWSVEREHYVLALDAEKRQVDAMTSNVGHLLWSGIINGERAGMTVARLMAPDMYNGWGCRTMAASDAAYNPIGYHIGTVWPHDTGIVAEGVRASGFAGDASQLALSLLDAAGYFDHRLPEVFAGFDRRETGMPVEYPTASRPQAWAAGATLLALRTLLGMDVEEGALRCSPTLPRGFGEVRLDNMLFRKRLLSVP
ncbi:MAG: glycogen debranching N-terminal domain-containing protein [Actinomycetota bacterium]